jgi:hypothetical protein
MLVPKQAAIVAREIPVVLLLTLLGPRPERILRRADVVLQAVTCDLPHAVLPHIAQPRPMRALTESVSHPRTRRIQLTLGGLVADLGPPLGELRDRPFEPIALRTHLAWLSRLALEAAALCAAKRSAATPSGGEALRNVRKRCGRHGLGRDERGAVSVREPVARVAAGCCLIGRSHTDVLG